MRNFSKCIVDCYLSNIEAEKSFKLWPIENTWGKTIGCISDGTNFFTFEPGECGIYFEVTTGPQFFPLTVPPVASATLPPLRVTE